MFVTNALKEANKLCATLINRFVYPVVNYYGESDGNETEYLKMCHFDNGQFSKTHLTNYNKQEFATTGVGERTLFYKTISGEGGGGIAGARGAAIKDALLAAGEYFMNNSPMNLFVPNTKRLPAIANIRSFGSDHEQPTGQFKAASLLCAIATGTWKGAAIGKSPPGGDGAFPPLLAMRGS